MSARPSLPSLTDGWTAAPRSIAEEIEDSLPPLEARLRPRAVDAVVARVTADLGDEEHPKPALLAALARCADGAVAEVDRLRGAESALVIAYQSAATPAERRELLARQLRIWARERGKKAGGPPLVGWLAARLEQAGDMSALGRNLDLEAAQERFATAIADRLDEIEVAYHALTDLARRLDDPIDALHVARDGGVLRLAMAHAEPSRPAPVRRSALLAAVALLHRIPARERLAHLGLDAARAVLAWSRGVGASRWVQIAALEIGVLLFPDEAFSLLADRIRTRNPDDRDGPILRRNALRLLGAAARPVAPVIPIAGAGAARAERPGHAEPPPEEHAPDSAPRLSAEPAGGAARAQPPAAPASADPLAIALLARDDPSEHVRQELVRQLVALGGEGALTALREIAEGDTSPRVRGYAMRELARHATDHVEAAPFAERAVRAALSNPGPPLASRAALDAVRTLCAGPYAPLPATTFVDLLSEFASRPAIAPDLCEEAAAALRLLEVESRPVAESIRQTIVAAASELLEGESAPVELPRDAEPRDVERALAVAARGDMTYSLRRRGPGRYLLTRGEPRGFRLWRLVHEMRTPMPDKRKGWIHTAGRQFAGEIVAPPVGMAEVTPTRVPGERHVYPPVGGWGSFVPRIDDLLAAAGLVQREVRLITARGAVTVRAPAELSRRLRARALITLRYDRYAQARMRALVAQEPAEQKRFSQLMGELGFSVALGDTGGEVDGRPYAVEPHLPSKYLAVALPSIWQIGRDSWLSAPSLPVWIDGFFSYLVSPAGNVPTQLAWVAWVVLAYMILRAAWIMTHIERARRGIPLTIGGWGTRGKSGSERLKAALFHALRYDVVVKTTGCEAMFIHAMRDLPAQEIFIYRPYDKATIWEQRNILAAGRNLRAQVFLWECMALQPLFVDTLCSEWMRDEITTLTNAYPDHEDIQGPGGEDVARVIARFMPTDGLSFTTEEQMLPLLKDAAQRRGTNLVAIPPIDADLLPVDLLDRLPYQEHPRNVALVLALAEHFGVDREFALVEIADHVILDLGVLKTYPTVTYRGRKLTFSNGMSANERAGFMSNWTRLAFDKHDIDATPGKATVMVVNNRADRVARSRVFAQIVVEDIGVDHVVLINSNLGGMMQFITEGLDTRLRDMTITGEGGKERALGRFDEQMKKVGVPARPGAFEDDLARMLRALPAIDEAAAAAIVASPDVAGKKGEPEAIEAAVKKALEAHAPPAGEDDIRPDIVHHAARLARRLARRDKARAEVEAALSRGADAEANQAFRVAFRELFLERIAVLWNADAKGDKVIDFITREVPPGFDARLMGSQNIKGTGLDFVYRWLSMDRVRTAIQRMQSNASSRREVLTFFLSYSDFGLIDLREALAAVRAAKEQGGAEWAEHANLMEGAIRRLEALDKEKTAALVVTGKTGFGTKVLLRVEQFVDHMDSVRRTRWAKIVMDDLFAMRIGHGQAALLLRDIVGRQKGGWLAKDLAKWLEARKAWMESRRKKKKKAETAAPPAGAAPAQG
ncbi:capsule biosynthesis protein CapB [Sorangium cellulosum]|uniref:Capsule biosynthesis protein CapB n=1 Tax=Sorangium cellulosum TaxID=56 RepID=A0A2L0F773_SORCE|nr:capsule biosynthesis protein CapB [Sorangium cellulosum]AUX47289.1 capsule biosynthesis protein CapB [Sorangium cellulosum]